MKIISPTPKTEIPEHPGWYEFAYAALSDGSLAVLRTRSEVRSQGWDAYFKVPFVRLSVLDECREVIHFDIKLPAPCTKFDRLDERHWLFASSGCSPSQPNAWIVDDNGHVERELCIGDAIEHVQCDAEQGIWVGYFDESMVGQIARFKQDGTVDRVHSDVLDCYALNVTRSATWACYYTDFPVVRIGFEGPTEQWSNDWRGARALAVKNDHVVLWGSHEPRQNSGRLSRLRRQPIKPAMAGLAAESLGDFEFDFPTEDSKLLVYEGGRNDLLHFVRQRRWYVLSVDDVLQAFR